MGLFDDIKKNRIIILVVSKNKSKELFGKVLPEMRRFSDRLGIITLQYPYESLIQEFRKNNRNLDDFYFVDAITATQKTPPIVYNCIFVSSPSSFSELKVAFVSLMEEKNREVIFFDRISGLIQYSDIHRITKFANDLIIDSHAYGKKVIFSVYIEDSEEFIKNISMFADKVIKI
jgi:hypothetical protein